MKAVESEKKRGGFHEQQEGREQGSGEEENRLFRFVEDHLPAEISDSHDAPGAIMVFDFQILYLRRTWTGVYQLRL